MVWASAAYGCDSITTKAVPMDSLPWKKKARQTKDNLERRHQTWSGLAYDRVDSGRDRSSCERPQDLGSFSTSGSRCIDAQCYLMMIMMMMKRYKMCYSCPNFDMSFDPVLDHFVENLWFQPFLLDLSFVQILNLIVSKSEMCLRL